ncbi:hypothetical protein AS888_21165 [Peribacillus simplex]|uniref:Uncharacterized protein n=1 Tax=Peribacillus simplex TaxID=1478 RepID=A0A109MX59_9BACI|nr:hypothetical protein AS888_21165 [Peribacillus simplex]
MAFSSKPIGTEYETPLEDPAAQGKHSHKSEGAQSLGNFIETKRLRPNRPNLSAISRSFFEALKCSFRAIFLFFGSLIGNGGCLIRPSLLVIIK